MPSSASSAFRIYKGLQLAQSLLQVLLSSHSHSMVLAASSNMARARNLATVLSLLAPLGSTLPHDALNDAPTPINERTAQEVIEHLGLIPNTAEKGFFFETFRDEATIPGTNRSYSTAIYYLLEGGGSSVWHHLDAPEVWHHYAGAPLTLSLWVGNGEPVRDMIMGPDIFGDQQPQVVIGKREWQSARSQGEWTLVGTTVAPGFEEAGSEFAESGWTPPGV